MAHSWTCPACGKKTVKIVEHIKRNHRADIEDGNIQRLMQRYNIGRFTVARLLSVANIIPSGKRRICPRCGAVIRLMGDHVLNVHGMEIYIAVNVMGWTAKDAAMLLFWGKIKPGMTQRALKYIKDTGAITSADIAFDMPDQLYPVHIDRDYVEIRTKGVGRVVFMDADAAATVLYRYGRSRCQEN